jgi:hypothetical protein
MSDLIVSIRLPKSIYKRLKRRADWRQVSIYSYVRGLLENDVTDEWEIEEFISGSNHLPGEEMKWINDDTDKEKEPASSQAIDCKL